MNLFEVVSLKKDIVKVFDMSKTFTCTHNFVNLYTNLFEDVSLKKRYWKV